MDADILQGVCDNVLVKLLVNTIFAMTEFRSGASARQLECLRRVVDICETLSKL